MIEALERLMPIANSDTTVVPGHGLVTDRHAVVQFHDMLQTIESASSSLSQRPRGPNGRAILQLAFCRPRNSLAFAVGMRTPRICPISSAVRIKMGAVTKAPPTP